MTCVACVAVQSPDDLEVDPYVIETILNHKTGTIRGVARVYNRAKYIREKRVALDSWGAYVERLAGDSSGNVVTLRAAGVGESAA